MRALGVRQLTATIFNHTVGSGIFVLPAFAVVQLGSAAPVAYLVCAAVMALVVLMFAEAGSRVTITGGPYAYVEVGLGPFFGFAAGILLAVSQISAAGAIAMLLAESVARLLGLTGAGWPAAIVVLFVCGLAAVNIRGVSRGARVIEVFTAAKLVPLLFFVVVGAFFISPANLRWDALPAAGQVATTVGTLIFAFTGIETALMPSGEVKDPTRTVPRAAMLALGAATLLYLAVQAVGLGVLGTALGDDKVAPLASATATFAGSTGAALVLAGASVSMFGWLTGSILAGPRALFALARDGFLPHGLAAVHPRFHTPHVAILAYGVLAIAISLDEFLSAARGAVESRLIRGVHTRRVRRLAAARARRAHRQAAVPDAGRHARAGAGLRRDQLDRGADDHDARGPGARRRVRAVACRLPGAAAQTARRGRSAIDLRLDLDLALALALAFVSPLVLPLVLA